MTDSPDIIGIVRELQKSHADCEQARRIDREHPNQTGLLSGLLSYHNSKTYHVFPAIAQALLIAVEALEEIGEYRKGVTQENGCFPNDPTLEALVAQQALSNIRSLPLA